MLYAAHVATLNQPDEKGFTQRTHLEGLVRRGVAKPADVRALDGPPFPETLDYLWTRYQRLAGMRPDSEHGLAAITPPIILAANELFRWALEPHECEALADLDAATRNPKSLLEGA